MDADDDIDGDDKDSRYTYRVSCTSRARTASHRRDDGCAMAGTASKSQTCSVTVLHQRNDLK
jgi:hypothetical protein